MAESQPPETGTKNAEEDVGSRTVVVEEETTEQAPPVLHLRLQAPKNEQKVKWSSDVVDNEFMGKKKSKCCCIYEKPKVFGESSSSSEDESGDEGCTPHCRGHKKKCYRHHKHEHDHEGHEHGHEEHAAG